MVHQDLTALMDHVVQLVDEVTEVDQVNLAEDV